MLILLEIEANLNSMKFGFDPDLGAVRTGEKNRDTGKQDKPNLFSSKN